MIGRLINADELFINLDGMMAVSPTGYIHGDTVADMISDAPTVDAEPVRHGKYIGTEYDGYADGCPVYYEWKCSECGCVFEEEEPTYNYCPHCGAKMDAQETEE